MRKPRKLAPPITAMSPSARISLVSPEHEYAGFSRRPVRPRVLSHFHCDAFFRSVVCGSHGVVQRDRARLRQLPSLSNSRIGPLSGDQRRRCWSLLKSDPASFRCLPNCSVALNTPNFPPPPFKAFESVYIRSALLPHDRSPSWRDSFADLNRVEIN